MGLAPSHAIFMHCLPASRGVGPGHEDDGGFPGIRVALRSVRRVGVRPDGGTLPVSVQTNRMTLCPGSAVGPNMQGQPPSNTEMPCEGP